MKLKKVKGNFGPAYVTADGNYKVEREMYERECECVTCRAGTTESGFGGHPTVADPGWIVWNDFTDDYPPELGSYAFGTKREAVAWLERYLAKKEAR